MGASIATKMAKLVNPALLYCVILLLLDSVVSVKVKNVRFGRSATWEEHIRKPRDTSDECHSEWFDNRRSCNPTEYTRYDEIGRRESGLLADVESQGSCGNCWAFAASHTFSDFRSLVADNRVPLLSADYVTRCVTEIQSDGIRYNGCCGYQPGKAMMHFKEQGAVSAECLRYSLGSYLPRDLSEDEKKDYKQANPLQCPASCSNNNPYVFAALAQYEYTLSGVSTSVLKRLIRQSGPVAATMVVDEGFHRQYKCGIYCQSNYDIVGYHAVEIVDYGTSPRGTPFWVVKNSWGSNQGENGYYRIRMGDLGIGQPGFSISAPLRTGLTRTYGEFTVSNLRAELRTCSGNAVANVNDSILLQSVGEFGLEELRESSLFACPDGSIASNAQLETICNGTIQVVAGSVVTIYTESRVTGCGAEFSVATVSLEVIVDLNHTFSLTDYDIVFNKRCSGEAIQHKYSFILLLVVIVIALEMIV